MTADEFAAGCERLLAAIAQLPDDDVPEEAVVEEFARVADRLLDTEPRS